MQKVCRVIESKDLNKGKYFELKRQASLLGDLRKEIWQRFGSLNGVGQKHREIRNLWVKRRDFSPLAAKAWKETLRDVIDDIKLYEESAKEKVRKAIPLRSKTDQERKQLYCLLKGNQWITNPYLSRKMRQHKKHGRTRVNNQIIVENGVYKQFKGIDGNTWLKIPSLVRGKMICIPLNSNITLKGCLRLLLKDGLVYVHHSIDKKHLKECGDLIVGVDKGYTEAFADSEGKFHGKDFGKILTEGTEKRNKKGKARNKLHQLAKKKNHKKAKIYKFNLGRKKLNETNEKQQKLIRNIAFQAAHSLVDSAKEVRAEDLTKPIGKKSRWKKYNRLMAGWAKGSLAEALESVTRARGSCLRLVNCAYTSQIDSKTHRLEGKRVGDKFYHVNGEVSQSDTNAAGNIRHRADDTEISLYTPYKEVKAILLSRLTDNGGVSDFCCDRPSRTPVANRDLPYDRPSTESESTRNLTASSCLDF